MVKKTSFCNFPPGNISQGTPRYNSSILEDMFIEDTMEFVNKHLTGAKELSDGLTLLKVVIAYFLYFVRVE